jgi:hypothetical protein
VVGVGAIGYRFFRADVAARVYRERLAQLARDYESLRATYNEAVRRTAVTELVVRGSTLSVRIRSDLGVIEEIHTPFDPRREVYVDYAVIDGRLWIRRVFDDRTAPGVGLLIDPRLASIDWDEGSDGAAERAGAGTTGAGEGPLYGKAIYRSLGEGRWVVSVTGDGSLGLARAGDADDVILASAPRIRDYEQMRAELDARIEAIGMGEVWRRLVSGE